MSIPKQAQEAADLAEQLHDQMFHPAEETAQEETVDEVVEEQEAAQEEPEVDYKALAEQYEQKWKSLQGMYNSSQKEYQDFKHSVVEKFNNLDVKPKEQTPQEDPRIAKFKEEYGEDMYDVMTYIADLRAEEKIASKVAPVTEQLASVEDAQVSVARNNFESYLDTKVQGDWRKLWHGEDPKFIEFLKQPDPSGLYTYGELCETYNDQWDADKLSRVFNNYMDTNKPKEVPKAPQPKSPAQEAMVAPSRSTTHSTPSANDKTIWTQESIREFEKSDRAGKYTADVSKAMWDDLLAAVGENRIRN